MPSPNLQVLSNTSRKVQLSHSENISRQLFFKQVPPLREWSARTSWAGGRGRRAQVVVTGLPLCLCGRWPDSLPASDKACPGMGWKLSGVQPPTPPSSGLQLTPCPVTPFSPWGIGVLTLITVTRKSCVPWNGGWGSSAPRAWAQPSGSAAWSFSGLPCCTAVSPLHCEPQEGGAGSLPPTPGTRASLPAPLHLGHA